MLPGACIIHFPKCKTVVLDYEVLGGMNGKERWCLSILLNSKIKKYTSLTLMSNEIKTIKDDKWFDVCFIETKAGMTPSFHLI